MKHPTLSHGSHVFAPFFRNLNAATRVITAETPAQAHVFAAELDQTYAHVPPSSLRGTNDLLTLQGNIRKALRPQLTRSLKELTGALTRPDGDGDADAADLGIDVGLIVQARTLGLFESGSYRDFRRAAYCCSHVLDTFLKGAEEFFGIDRWEQDTSPVHKVDAWEVSDMRPTSVPVNPWDDEPSAITSFDGIRMPEPRRLITYDDVGRAARDSDIDVFFDPLFPTGGDHVKNLAATLKKSGLTADQRDVAERILTTYYDELEHYLAARGPIERDRYAATLIDALKAPGNDETLYLILSQLQDEQSGDTLPFID